jgi:hypothetical protein
VEISIHLEDTGVSMSAGKIIAYIAAAIFIGLGGLYILSAFGSVPQPENIIVGIIMVGIGFGLIFIAGRKKPGEKEEVKLQIDLSGDVNLDTLSCRSCGGQLSADNISMVAGAPVVSCPFCGTSYQLTEEPKW